MKSLKSLWDTRAAGMIDIFLRHGVFCKVVLRGKVLEAFVPWAESGTRNNQMSIGVLSRLSGQRTTRSNTLSSSNTFLI